MSGNQKQLKGQILVIVLLVLSILSIFVVAVATNTRRDVLEREQTEKYEQYYSLTEKRMLQVLDEIQLDTTVTGLENVFTECKKGSGTINQYTCQFQDVPQQGSLDTALVKLTIQDSNRIDGMTVKKDQNFKINLEDGTARGYLGRIDMTWTGSKVAWIISLDYKVPATGDFLVAKDVYDQSAVFYQPINTHSFVFTQNTANGAGKPASNATSFRIDSITGLPANFEAKSLRIKPIMVGGDELTELTLAGGTGFPTQVRKIIGEGISSSASQTGSKSPAVILEIQIPLHAAPIDLLDYVIRSEDVVKPQSGPASTPTPSPTPTGGAQGTPTIPQANLITPFDPQYTTATQGGSFPIIVTNQQSTMSTMVIIRCASFTCDLRTEAVYNNNLGIGLTHKSMVVPSDNNPFIVAYQGKNVVAVKCGDSSCISGNTSNIVSLISPSGNTNYSISEPPVVTIGSDGLPIIAHFDRLYMRLYITKCGNAACSAGNVQTHVDDAQFSDSTRIGSYPELIMNGNQLLVSSVATGTFNPTKQGLWMTSCNNLTCGSRFFYYFDNGIPTNSSTSRIAMAKGPDNIIKIGFLTKAGGLNASVNFLSCTNTTCSSTTNRVKLADLTETDFDTSGAIKMTVPSDNMPVFVVAHNDYYRILKCNNTSCTSATFRDQLAPNRFVELNNTFVIGGNGHLITVFTDTNTNPNRIIVYRCTTSGTGCTNVVIPGRT